MIERDLQSRLLEVAGRYPAVTLTGPRQSGKTTLCRGAFPKHAYVSLEAPAERDFAQRDPLGFLARFDGGVILDEIQRVPDLPSTLQGIIDAESRAGRFVLTGSQNLSLIESVSQSLAGRTAVLHLLPLCAAEAQRFEGAPGGLFDLMWSGGYPRIFDRHLPAQEWLGAYIATYVERDVRLVINVGDLLAFQTFLRLGAGRSGQVLNLSALGGDSGITHPTAKSWISVLEATFVAFRLPAFHRNLGKRLVKAPKLYFYDTGLLCHLLGIETPAQIMSHPLRGALFENWVITELIKQAYNHGHLPRLYFYRDQRGHEVDLLIDRGQRWVAVEIKSAGTPSAHFFDSLDVLEKTVRGVAETRDIPMTRVVVYGGDETQERASGTLLSWRDLARFNWFE